MLMYVAAFAVAAAAVIPPWLLASFRVDVPGGTAPKVDGTVEPGEWDGAWRSAPGRPAVLLRHDGQDVYLAVTASAFAVTSVYIVRGNQLRILHASAAIGDSTYERSGARWKVVSGFSTWERYRDAADLDARGPTFFAGHQWMGSHMRLGATGDTEMRLAGSLIEGARIAVTYYDPGARKLLLVFPASVAGDVTAHEIQAGYNPELLTVDPSDWAILTRRP